MWEKPCSLLWPGRGKEPRESQLCGFLAVLSQIPFLIKAQEKQSCYIPRDPSGPGQWGTRDGHALFVGTLQTANSAGRETGEKTQAATEEAFPTSPRDGDW